MGKCKPTDVEIGKDVLLNRYSSFRISINMELSTQIRIKPGLESLPNIGQSFVSL